MQENDSRNILFQIRKEYMNNTDKRFEPGKLFQLIIMG